MEPEIITLIAALAGATVGSLGTILVTWINNRSAERRHFKELVFTVAVENWKKAVDFATQQPGRREIAPLDDFILGLLATADLFLRRKISEENIEDILAGSDRLGDRIYEWRFTRDRQGQERN